MSEKSPELRLKTIDNILGGNIEEGKEISLQIHESQRPYRWPEHLVKMLFNDLYKAYKENKDEYRLGNIILYKDKEEEYNKITYKIIDGQQRLTTISILLYILDKSEEGIKINNLLNCNYFKESFSSIKQNHDILEEKIKKIDNKTEFAKFIRDKCKFVQIIVYDEQEAFQFFDSQNSRGKELEPHDLLKAYHLREMINVEEKEKIEIIEKFEEIEEQEIADLFLYYLYPIFQWYKCKDGIGNEGTNYRYSKDKRHVFEGIKPNKSSNNYNYFLYHLSSNLFIDNLNEFLYKAGSSHYEQGKFQITMPFIAGKRFFEFCFYYNELKKQIEDKITKYYKEGQRQELLLESGTGNKYIKNLFITLLMFFCDKFNLDSLTNDIIDVFYKYSYCLRLMNRSVYLSSINNYALDKEKKYYDFNLFNKIFETNSIEELEDEINLFINNIEKDKRKHDIIEKSNYKDIVGEYIFPKLCLKKNNN